MIGDGGSKCSTSSDEVRLKVCVCCKEDRSDHHDKDRPPISLERHNVRFFGYDCDAVSSEIAVTSFFIYEMNRLSP